MAQRPDYGLDAPRLVRRFLWRSLTLFGIGLGMYAVNRGDPDAARAATTLFAILGAIGAAYFVTAVVMYWSSRVAKLGLRETLLSKINWRGDERVLDVGCGRGLLLIGAAKKLKSGKAFGADVWVKEDLSGNSQDAARKNAEIEGVADRVKLDNADARKLPYPDGHFDVVLSSLAIHNLKEHADRERALREMWRVLKPGGRMVIFDILKVGEYARQLAALGARVVERSGTKFYWMLPSGWLVVDKS